MPRYAAEILGENGKHLRRIFIVDNCSGDGVGEELQDPADDYTVADGDSERTDDGDQTDNRPDPGIFLWAFHVKSLFKCAQRS